MENPEESKHWRMASPTQSELEAIKIGENKKEHEIMDKVIMVIVCVLLLIIIYVGLPDYFD